MTYQINKITETITQTKVTGVAITFEDPKDITALNLVLNLALSEGLDILQKYYPTFSSGMVTREDIERVRGLISNVKLSLEQLENGVDVSTNRPIQRRY